jgi:hypothetical protein
MGKQPVLLQLSKNYCASAPDMQSPNKTGAIIFISSVSKIDEEFRSLELRVKQYVFVNSSAFCDI